jgi:hypothetical protein
MSGKVKLEPEDTSEPLRGEPMDPLVELERRMDAKFERFFSRMEDAATKKRDDDRYRPSMEKKEEKAVDNRSMRRDPDGDEAGIVLDEEISSKRTANEIAVLVSIVKLTDLEDVGDIKKRMVEVQLVANKRIFLLELVNKVGWGVALAYQQLYPRELTLVPSKLKAAVEYSETLARVDAKKKRIVRTEERSSGNSSGKGSFGGKSVGGSGAPAEKPSEKSGFVPYGKFETCFRCGGKGHWARDCPTKTGDKGGDAGKKPGNN